MYAALLGVAVVAGAPPLFSALMLGFFGNLMASTTHYSSGPAPILYAAGYVTQKRWWLMNLALGVVYFVIWLGLGSLWMKLIGLMYYIKERNSEFCFLLLFFIPLYLSLP